MAIQGQTIEQRIVRHVSRRFGLSKRGLLNTFQPDLRDQAAAKLQALVASGEVLEASTSFVGVKEHTHYFARPEQIDEWKRSTAEQRKEKVLQPPREKLVKAINAPKTRQGAEAVSANRARFKAQPMIAKPAPKAAAVQQPAGPVDYSRAKLTVCPAGVDHRHTFTGQPGRWVDSSQCRPWAMAAVGAA